MNTAQAFGKALSTIRVGKGMTQEDFTPVSGRTYISELERGMKSPTLEKIEGLAGCLDVHPLSLLLLTYTKQENINNVRELFERTLEELGNINEV